MSKSGQTRTHTHTHIQSRITAKKEIQRRKSCGSESWKKRFMKSQVTRQHECTFPFEVCTDQQPQTPTRGRPVKSLPPFGKSLENSTFRCLFLLVFFPPTPKTCNFSNYGEDIKDIPGIVVQNPTDRHGRIENKYHFTLRELFGKKVILETGEMWATCASCRL